jgi:hypothetical protein
VKIPVLDVSTENKNIDSYGFEYFIRYNIKIRSVSAENDQPIGKLFSIIPPLDHSEAHCDSQANIGCAILMEDHLLDSCFLRYMSQAR